MSNCEMPRHLSERAIWLSRWILPHEPALRHQLARWRLPEGLEPDDVVQEAYARLAAIESIEEIREPRNYLFQVARSIVLSHLRRSRVVSIAAIGDLAQFDIADDQPSPEVQASDRDQLQRLALAVADLPGPQRSAFMLRVIDNLSYGEIGVRLGISENAAQKRVARSLILLMDRFGYGGNGEPRTSSPDEAKVQLGGHVRAEDQ